MAAETLNCPMCGAPAASDSSRCEHCGARLATVACPSCFGMMFLGAKFCSHCGARADRTEVNPATPQRCPRCRVNLELVSVGPMKLKECPRCEGIWADASSLEQICADREKQAAVLGLPGPAPDPAENAIEPVRYVPCPVCGKLMNRVNFARCSHVVVDVCKAHGTWFDRDELRRIVEFIRAGGLEVARAKEIEELEDQRRQLEQTHARTESASPGLFSETKYADAGVGISATAALLKHLLHRDFEL